MTLGNSNKMKEMEWNLVFDTDSGWYWTRCRWSDRHESQYPGARYHRSH